MSTVTLKVPDAPRNSDRLWRRCTSTGADRSMVFVPKMSPIPNPLFHNRTPPAATIAATSSTVAAARPTPVPRRPRSTRTTTSCAGADGAAWSTRGGRSSSISDTGMTSRADGPGSVARRAAGVRIVTGRRRTDITPTGIRGCGRAARCRPRIRSTGRCHRGSAGIRRGPLGTPSPGGASTDPARAWPWVSTATRWRLSPWSAARVKRAWRAEPADLDPVTTRSSETTAWSGRGLELAVEDRDRLVLPDPVPEVPAADPPGGPPVQATGEPHERGDERGADQECVDEHRERETDAEHLEDRHVRRRDPDEDDREQQGRRRHDAARLLQTDRDRVLVVALEVVLLLDP